MYPNNQFNPYNQLSSNSPIIPNHPNSSPNINTTGINLYSLPVAPTDETVFSQENYQVVTNWDSFAIQDSAKPTEFSKTDYRIYLSNKYGPTIVQISHLNQMLYLFKVNEHAKFVNTYGAINEQNTWQQIQKTQGNCLEFAGVLGIKYLLIRTHLNRAVLMIHPCIINNEGKLVFYTPNRGFEQTYNGQSYNNENERNTLVFASTPEQITHVVGRYESGFYSSNSPLQPEPISYEAARKSYFEMYTKYPSTQSTDPKILNSLVTEFTKTIQLFTQEMTYLKDFGFTHSTEGQTYYSDLEGWIKKLNPLLLDLVNRFNFYNNQQQQQTPSSFTTSTASAHTLFSHKSNQPSGKNTSDRPSGGLVKIGGRVNGVRLQSNWVYFDDPTAAQAVVNYMNQHKSKISKEFKVSLGTNDYTGKHIIKGFTDDNLKDAVKDKPGLFPQAVIDAFPNQNQSLASKMMSLVT